MAKTTQTDFPFLLAATLRAIIESPSAPSQNDLWEPGGAGLVNDWLTSNGVLNHGRTFTSPIMGRSKLARVIHALREKGFLCNQGYIPTKRGKEQDKFMGKDWRKWPEKLSQTHS